MPQSAQARPQEATANLPAYSGVWVWMESSMVDRNISLEMLGQGERWLISVKLHLLRVYWAQMWNIQKEAISFGRIVFLDG